MSGSRRRQVLTGGVAAGLVAGCLAVLTLQRPTAETPPMEPPDVEAVRGDLSGPPGPSQDLPSLSAMDPPGAAPDIAVITAPGSPPENAAPRAARIVAPGPLDGVASQTTAPRLPGAETGDTAGEIPAALPFPDQVVPPAEQVPPEPAEFTAAERATPIRLLGRGDGGLSEAGFNRLEAVPSRFTPRRDVVRHFRDEDADLARRISDRIGAEVQDLTSYRPVPEGPAIEVWLAGD